jgi:hypothetical protein
MIKAGIDATAHFTMKTTIDQNGISTSTTAAPTVTTGGTT